MAWNRTNLYLLSFQVPNGNNVILYMNLALMLNLYDTQMTKECWNIFWNILVVNSFFLCNGETKISDDKLIVACNSWFHHLEDK